MNHPQPAAPAAGTEQSEETGVAMIGYSFMGAAHSHAWRSAPRFFDLPLLPRMRVLSGREPCGVKAAAARLGWEETETSWETAVARDDVQLVDICTPGEAHGQIAIAARARPRLRARVHPPGRRPDQCGLRG